MKTIPLTQDKVALVDDELFDELNKFKWYALRARKTFYAVRSIRLPFGKRITCQMHCEVLRLLGVEVLETVDHGDRNGLNNQRYNLRPATRKEQGQNRAKRTDNTSGCIGVSWDRHKMKWKSQTMLAGKQKHLGYFDDKVEAARVRDQFIQKHHGEFAVLNF